MDDGWVKSLNVERDLGVLISRDLKFSKPCLLAKNKANLMLGIFFIEEYHAACGLCGTISPQNREK